MTTFDEREQAFENKFKHDQETLFKIQARRAKLLGLWAAEKLGYSGAEADAYARQVIEADLEEAGPDDMIRKIFEDFSARDVDISRHRIEKQADQLLDLARQQITTQ